MKNIFSFFLKKDFTVSEIEKNYFTRERTQILFLKKINYKIKNISFKYLIYEKFQNEIFF